MSKIMGSVGIAVAVLMFVAGFMFLNRPVEAAEGRESGRLLTIHDRGQEKVLLSNAATIGDALAEAGVTLDAHDAVEPAVTEKMVASQYNVNIYRARPVTVVDGPSRQKIVTAYQTAEQITKDVGITLYPEDTTTLARSTNLLAGGAGLELTIDRATEFGFILYGTRSVARTQGETVGDMLKEKNITIGENDRVSVPLSTVMNAGVEVQIWREGHQTVTVEESVSFTNEQIRDANQETGYKAIQIAGVDGKKNVTYEVEIRDGVEVARVEIASIVTSQPTNQVEVIGTKSKTLPYTGGGTKTEWLAASNIPQESWGYADFMVTKESGWNPNARNASSGACGLAQALPCSKLGADWTNPIVSLNWMNGYVNGRYYDGSPYVQGLCAGITNRWHCAYTFWQAKKWY